MATFRTPVPTFHAQVSFVSNGELGSEAVLNRPGFNLDDKAQFLKNNQDSILVKDDKDFIYVYSQTFNYNGGTFTRLGFISLIKLEELSKGVLPHEKTLEKPFKDRLDLIENTRANFGSVFLLYDDREKVIDGFIKEMINSNNADIATKRESCVTGFIV